MATNPTGKRKPQNKKAMLRQASTRNIPKLKRGTVLQDKNKKGKK